jgi:3-oxoacyl-[acyl-carrier-protein] synthase II
MRERVVITAIGCISPFGIGHSSLTRALVSGTSGIVPITRFDTSACLSHRAAMITGFDPQAFVAPMRLRRMDAGSRLALACAHVLIDEVGPGAVNGSATGVALGTWSAGLDALSEYLEALTDHGPTAVPAMMFSNTISNAPASLCAIEFGLRGPNVTFNQREVSAFAAIAYAVDAIRHGRTTAMVAGGADWLDETFFKVYDSFRVLSPAAGRGGQPATDAEAARPFDANRNGLVLGEGAFLILLESARAARERGARVHAEIAGIGATSSVTGLNQWPADGSGLVRAMRLAIDDASLDADDVGAVIAAANGSPQLDRVEAEALRSLFGRRVAAVAALKGALGESGAAGAAAVVTAALLTDRLLPPTAGFYHADPECPVAVSAAPQPLSTGVFIVNGIAGGGAHYSIVVSTPTVA